MSGKDYKQVLKVWNKFEKKTMKDYHYLHLKCDVLFLADIRNRFELGYNAQYVKVDVELIADADMYLFSEKGMRVKVSYISKGYSKANKKYLKSYNSNQELKHIKYFGRE